ncbi:MAG TPA: hypothetical protein VIY48_10260, partial [Candidatus Paceibacterota bacterium]
RIIQRRSVREGLINKIGTTYADLACKVNFPVRKHARFRRPRPKPSTDPKIADNELHFLIFLWGPLGPHRIIPMSRPYGASQSCATFPLAATAPQLTV